MRAVMDAVKKGMSIKRATEEHAVLRSTLQDRKCNPWNYATSSTILEPRRSI